MNTIFEKNFCNQMLTYKVGLKFINKILKNMGKKRIGKLIDFIDIDIRGINSDLNLKMFNLMEFKLLVNFNIFSYQSYRKRFIKMCPLSFIDLIALEFGYKLRYKYRDGVFLYSIVDVDRLV